MKLGRFFTLAELTRSPTAKAMGINNEPPREVIDRLRLLVVHVLDPLREALGRPITVTSGYRSPAVNLRVDGASSSQHVLGEAADIECPGVSTADLARRALASGLPFDQLILEFHDLEVPSSGWVHISHRALGPQRRQSLRAAAVKGKTVYSSWP